MKAAALYSLENTYQEAFELLRDGLVAGQSELSGIPHMAVQSDQIVWGRSPVRIDIAGGWTDTPPYCLMEGGNVVNLAIELNGQPPLQTYIKPCKEPHIILRSIDLGATEVVETYAAPARNVGDSDSTHARVCDIRRPRRFGA